MAPWNVALYYYMSTVLNPNPSPVITIEYHLPPSFKEGREIGLLFFSVGLTGAGAKFFFFFNKAHFVNIPR